MKRLFFILMVFFVGCAPLEWARLFGMGVRRFRRQGKTYSKVYQQDFFSTYEEVTKGLKELKASFYRGTRKEGFLIAINFAGVFAQCNDSTEVAVFFTEMDKLKTRVEISSLNYSLAEFVASEIFNGPKDKTVPDAWPQTEEYLGQEVD